MKIKQSKFKLEMGSINVLIIPVVILFFLFLLYIIPDIIKEKQVEKTYSYVKLLKTSILNEYKFELESKQKLINNLPKEFKKDNELYIESISTKVSLSGMTEKYPMSIMTLEDMPYNICKPLVTKLYNDFDQVIPYSQKGGIGTCFENVAIKKPSLEVLLENCMKYEDNQKIWLALLIKTNSKGACNIPD